MAKATHSDSAVGRPVSLRMRHDLTIRAQYYGGRRFWAIKDPVSLRYFQLRDEEYFVLRALDGTTSPREIKERFEREFAPLLSTLVGRYTATLAHAKVRKETIRSVRTALPSFITLRPSAARVLLHALVSHCFSVVEKTTFAVHQASLLALPPLRRAGCPDM